MRAAVKFGALLLVAALVQCTVDRGRTLRDAWFDLRAWYYQSCEDYAAIDRLAEEGQRDLQRDVHDAGFDPADRASVTQAAACNDVDDDGAAAAPPMTTGSGTGRDGAAKTPYKPEAAEDDSSDQ